jgi:hypothetical protein
MALDDDVDSLEIDGVVRGHTTIDVGARPPSLL